MLLIFGNFWLQMSNTVVLMLLKCFNPERISKNSISSFHGSVFKSCWFQISIPSSVFNPYLDLKNLKIILTNCCRNVSSNDYMYRKFCHVTTFLKVDAFKFLVHQFSTSNSVQMICNLYIFTDFNSNFILRLC